MSKVRLIIEDDKMEETTEYICKHMSIDEAVAGVVAVYVSAEKSKLWTKVGYHRLARNVKKKLGIK